MEVEDSRTMKARLALLLAVGVTPCLALAFYPSATPIRRGKSVYSAKRPLHFSQLRRTQVLRGVPEHFVEPVPEDIVQRVDLINATLDDDQTFSAVNSTEAAALTGLPIVVDKDEVLYTPTTPTFRECLGFVLPALGIYACPPLMSLIDASFIGRSSSLELAALGPASIISDSAPLPLLFLSIASTNLIARAFAEKNEAALARVSKTALGMGVVGGIAMTILLYAWARPISSLYCASELSLIPACTEYVAIRALALPAVVVSTIAQAICIGTKDTKTPMASVALAGGINFLGDLLLVTWLKMGIAGAAWATALSQILSGGLLLRALQRRGFLKRIDSESSERSWSTAKQILSFFPFLFVMGVKIGWHNSNAATAASFGGAQAAAHTALAAVGMLCFTFGDVGSSLSQAFLPAFVGKEGTKGEEPSFDLEAAMPTIKQLLKCTLSISATVVCLSSIIIGFFGRQITGDPAVLHEMQKTLPWIAAALSFHGSAVTLEGLLLARRKLKGLTAFYAFLAITIVAIQVFTRRWGLGLAGVWGCYVWVSASRVITFSAMGGLVRPRRWWSNRTGRKRNVASVPN